MRSLRKEVEAVVSERPLTYVEEDSLPVIRPTGFLKPKSILSLNPGALEDDEGFKNVKKKRQQLVEWCTRSCKSLELFWNFCPLHICNGFVTTLRWCTTTQL